MARASATARLRRRGSGSSGSAACHGAGGGSGIPDHDLLAYRLPDTKPGLEVDGVAFSGLIECRDPIAFRDLPPGEHRLATIILNWGIAHDLR